MLVESTNEVEYRARLSRVLGDAYELRELIGRGGFGAVYRARDKRLDRDVAVKALRHDLFPSPALLQRFNREAKAVANLRHPNILPVYTVGEGEGIAYMVMPLVEGESLEACLAREGTLAPAEATRITAESADALEAAHKQGLVHRDVKPANIMLEGDGRRVLLMDFGIAKPLESDDAGLTGTGMIVGSPAYMSPEQARGEKDLDGRSDIYSLGAVAYEMLSGKRPFVAANLHELVYKQVTQKVPDLATFAPTVPPRVTQGVMRCLEMDPARRWQTAADLAQTLSSREPNGAGHERGADLSEESWISRRGPYLLLLSFVLYFMSFWVWVSISGGGAPLTGWGEVSFLWARRAVLTLAAVAIGEGVAGAFIRHRRGGSWRQIARYLFGQPEWWPAWYPPRLRVADSVWSRLPFSMKVLRTFLWLEFILAPAGAILVLFVLPVFRWMAQESGQSLPLSLRVFTPLVWVAVYAAPIALGMFAWYGYRYRAKYGVPLTAFIASLVTLRGSHWQGSSARVILKD